jgi:hypothetical protein
MTPLQLDKPSLTLCIHPPRTNQLSHSPGPTQVTSINITPPPPPPENYPQDYTQHKTDPNYQNPSITTPFNSRNPHNIFHKQIALCAPYLTLSGPSPTGPPFTRLSPNRSPTLGHPIPKVAWHTLNQPQIAPIGPPSSVPPRGSPPKNPKNTQFKFPQFNSLRNSE